MEMRISSNLENELNSFGLNQDLIQHFISFTFGNTQLVGAFLGGDVDAPIHEEHSALSAAKDQEKLQGIEHEIQDKECAPSKYYEYLHSLNDRQREAACSDVNVPLMIVAGPGSGKVHSLSSLYFVHLGCIKYRFLASYSIIIVLTLVD
jgi:hypothetical protein